MSDMDHSPDVPEDLVELGRIVAAHGVRGQVKIQPHGADCVALYANKTWWLRAAEVPVVSGSAAAGLSAAAARCAATMRPVRVLTCQRHGDVLLAQLDGVKDRDQALALKGATLHLPRRAFPQPEDDEYYWVDLIGCDLYGKTVDQQDVLLGQVTQVSDNGAHALLHVAQKHLPNDDHGSKRTRECLIPFVAAHVLRVDLSQRRIDSNWPADF